MRDIFYVNSASNLHHRDDLGAHYVIDDSSGDVEWWGAAAEWVRAPIIVAACTLNLCQLIRRGNVTNADWVHSAMHSGVQRSQHQPRPSNQFKPVITVVVRIIRRQLAHQITRQCVIQAATTAASAVR